MRGIACKGLTLVTSEVGRKGIIGAKVRSIFQEGGNDQLFLESGVDKMNTELYPLDLAI